MNGNLSAKLIDYIVYVSLGLVAYIVVIGGILCIKDNNYNFTEYVVDLRGVYKLLLVAVIGVIGRDFGKRRNGNGSK
jgi:hypothetical protein